jgi:hypothetical protein
MGADSGDGGPWGWRTLGMGGGHRDVKKSLGGKGVYRGEGRERRGSEEKDSGGMESDVGTRSTGRRPLAALTFAHAHEVS